MQATESVLFPLMSVGRRENVVFRAGVGLAAEELAAGGWAPALKEALARGATPVFPSHFFEFAERDALLARLGADAAACWVQLSAGFELDLCFEAFRAARGAHPALGLELVFDRAPHARDRLLLSELKAEGAKVRYVFVPSVDFEPLGELRKLHPAWLASLRIYLPRKLSLVDSRLDPARAFVFLEKARLEEGWPPFAAAEHLWRAESAREGESEASAEWRRTLDPALFLRSFDQAGAARGARRFLKGAAARAFTAPIVWLPFVLLWLVKDPGAAIFAGARRAYWWARRAGDLLVREARAARSFVYWRVLFRTLCSLERLAGCFLWAWGMALRLGGLLLRGLGWLYRGYGQGVRFAVWLFWHSAHPAYHAFRRAGGALYAHLIVRAYYGVVTGLYYRGLHRFYHRVLRRAYFLGFHVFCFLSAYARSPLWSTERYLPFLYWPLVFPFVKAYWFTAYQVRTRLLRVPLEARNGD